MRFRMPLWMAMVIFSVIPAMAAVAPPTKPVISPPLGLLLPADQPPEVKFVVPNYELPRHTPAAGASVPIDTAVQIGGSAHSPDVIGVNFEGVGVFNSAPPDTNGRIGKNR